MVTITTGYHHHVVPAIVQSTTIRAAGSTAATIAEAGTRYRCRRSAAEARASIGAERSAAENHPWSSVAVDAFDG